MISVLDRFLDRITMYRLVIYVLLAYLGAAASLGVVGQLAFSGSAIILTAGAIVGLAWITNHLFAKVYRAPVHSESAIITGLILVLIVSPYQSGHGIGLIFWAPVLAIAGKYILAWHKQHIWNPAAIAVAITALFLQQSASWWVGTSTLLPIVVIGGWLIVKKQRRWEVVWTFFLVAGLGIVAAGLIRQTSVWESLRHLALNSPAIFFATIMLTEPLTMPPGQRQRIAYAATIGLLFIPQLHLGNTYSTPELALVLGNTLFFGLAGRARYILTLTQKIRLAPQTYEFVFTSADRPDWIAGQYFEWTLGHPQSDQRGQRRYFTVASSPSEPHVRLGIKFASERLSSFKQSMLAMRAGDSIVAGQRDGDFTLPKDPNQKLVFIAGGIGVTPFRSMIQWLVDQQQPRDIALIYAANSVKEFVYTNIFNQAETAIRLRTLYLIADPKRAPANWSGLTGYLTPEIIQQQLPDYAERTFYLSGPQAMVNAYEAVLKKLDLPRRQIKTDYFPGFA